MPKFRSPVQVEITEDTLNMPMTWNQEADAKLFAAILKVRNLSFSKEDLAALAQAMRPECTPKAITHRVHNIKQKAAAVTSNGTATTPIKRARAPRQKGSTSKTKIPSSKEEKKRRNARDPLDDEVEEEDYDKKDRTTSPESPIRDRSHLRRSSSANARAAYTEHSDDEEDADAHVTKRIKAEEVDEMIEADYDPAEAQLQYEQAQVGGYGQAV